MMLGLLLAASGLDAQSNGEQAVAYFDFFNQAHGTIVQRNMDYLQHAVHSDDEKLIASKRIAMEQQVDAVRQQLRDLPPFAGDAGLKAAMETVLDNYKSLFSVTFPEVELLKMNAEQSFEQMEAYMKAQDDAEKRMAHSSNEFLLAQRKFAKANSIELVEDSKGSEIDQINALNVYYRTLLLQYFKISKANALFMDALSREDAETMKSSRVALLKLCAAELPKLRAIGAFNGNTSYRDAVIREVEWTEEMAKQAYIDLIRATDPATELTNEIIDQFNAAIQRVNTEMGPLVDNVNKASQQLMRDNVPKPTQRAVKQI